MSHLSEAAFWQLMDCTQAPILASHSNCRALCDYTRNLTDDQLRALAQTGGLLRTGPTGTNVNDLSVLLIGKPRLTF